MILPRYINTHLNTQEKEGNKIKRISYMHLVMAELQI